MTSITKCRICGQSDLRPILSLGETPLANSLLRKEQLAQPEKRYPLEVVFCPDCTLVQITETVDPVELFRHYLYFSSFSDTMIAHAASLASCLISQQSMGSHSLVVEIASNDGYLLKNYVAAGIPVLGIEPAQNIAAIANKQGIPTKAEFFDLSVAQQLVADGFIADIFHAHNVLAHVANLHGVVAGIAVLLAKTGLAVIEVPYVKDVMDRTEFDTIYHEHLCYFSLTALDHLFRRHELFVVDVERTQIHGGSLQVYVGCDDLPSGKVSQLLKEEKEWGVDQLSFYTSFAEKVELLRKDLCSEIANIKRHGARIAVYGASAKGSTLLNYFGLGADSLDYVVDRSTAKQGFYTPGTHLPIYAPEKLLEDRPDYVLLLTWNFAEEILLQQSEYRQLGGKFILPLPEVKIL